MTKGYKKVAKFNIELPDIWHLGHRKATKAETLAIISGTRPVKVMFTSKDGISVLRAEDDTYYTTSDRRLLI